MSNVNEWLLRSSKDSCKCLNANKMNCSPKVLIQTNKMRVYSKMHSYDAILCAVSNVRFWLLRAFLKWLWTLECKSINSHKLSNIFESSSQQRLTEGITQSRHKPQLSSVNLFALEIFLVSIFLWNYSRFLLLLWHRMLELCDISCELENCVCGSLGGMR